MANVIDPTDESHVAAAFADQMTMWYEMYKVRGGDPLPEKEPTPDQLSALHTRVVVLGLEPYADFSILTPFGRRTAKTLRHRGWFLQEDGSYMPADVPGPGDLHTWASCWKVYEVIMLMLYADGGVPVVVSIALEAYYEAFTCLAREFPEAWHLCQSAEDRCRAEHFPRLARHITKQKGRVASWSEVFEAAAADDHYWDREVRRPAVAFLARGKRPRTGAGETSSGAAEDRGEVRGRGNKKQRKRERERGPDRERRDRDGGGAGTPPQKTLSSADGDKHPKKNQKGQFVTTREGREICFKFSSGAGCPSPCPNGRQHCCQKCLGSHKTADHKHG